MSKKISLAGRKSKHGTTSGYSRGCKCKACSTAQAEYQADYYQTKRKA